MIELETQTHQQGIQMEKSLVVIALDIGLKRIGVAKAVCGIPLCLAPILRQNRNQAANAVNALVNTAKADVLVVGIPMKDNLESKEDAITQMQRRIKHFVGLLTLPKNTKVVFIDENFSSQEALEKLEDKKMRKKAHSKDGTLDSHAALVILERFLATKQIP